MQTLRRSRRVLRMVRFPSYRAGKGNPACAQRGCKCYKFHNNTRRIGTRAAQRCAAGKPRVIPPARNSASALSAGTGRDTK